MVGLKQADSMHVAMGTCNHYSRKQACPHATDNGLHESNTFVTEPQLAWYSFQGSVVHCSENYELNL